MLFGGKNARHLMKAFSLVAGMALAGCAAPKNGVGEPARAPTATTAAQVVPVQPAATAEAPRAVTPPPFAVPSSFAQPDDNDVMNMTTITPRDKAFFSAMQDAISHEKKDWVVDHVYFPAPVMLNGRRTMVDAKQFAAALRRDRHARGPAMRCSSKSLTTCPRAGRGSWWATAPALWFGYRDAPGNRGVQYFHPHRAHAAKRPENGARSLRKKNLRRLSPPRFAMNRIVT